MIEKKEEVWLLSKVFVKNSRKSKMWPCLKTTLCFNPKSFIIIPTSDDKKESENMFEKEINKKKQKKKKKKQKQNKKTQKKPQKKTQKQTKNR